MGWLAGRQKCPPFLQPNDAYGHRERHHFSQGNVVVKNYQIALPLSKLFM